MSTIRLGDLAMEIASGFACGKDNLVAEGLPHLRPFNIGMDGRLSLSEVYQVPARFAPRGKGQLRRNDILFNNTNSPELVGKSALVGQDMDAGFSNHITRLRLDPERCLPAFVVIQLWRLWSDGYFREQCNQWVSQAAFGPRHLADLEIPLPPIDDQQRIVDILDRAASIERLRRQASAHLRDFIPALFLKMFGDPMENPMGWPTGALGDLLRSAQYGSSQKADGMRVRSPCCEWGT